MPRGETVIPIYVNGSRRNRYQVANTDSSANVEHRSAGFQGVGVGQIQALPFWRSKKIKHL